MTGVNSAGWIGRAIAAASIVLAVASGHAQPRQERQPPAVGEPRPWAHGVSEAEQAIALDLYRAGNHEFAESRFVQALAKYRQAIRHWNHPAIRFNLAVSLINLGQLIEARYELAQGLAYGAGALGADAYAQGQTYRRLLDAQLVSLTVRCAEPEAIVTLDGKRLFTGPGEVETVVLPGEHQLVATKGGYATATQAIVLVAGRSTAYDLRPLREPPSQVPPPCDSGPRYTRSANARTPETRQDRPVSPSRETPAHVLDPPARPASAARGGRELSAWAADDRR